MDLEVLIEWALRSKLTTRQLQAGRRPPVSRRARLSARWCLVACVALILAASLPVERTRAQQPSEYELKAAFLLNFAKFIDWPTESFSSPQASFSICVLGKDPFGRSLDDLLPGRTIGGRPVMIVRLKDTLNARHCQIVFVSTSESHNLAEIFDGLHGANTLTVGESEHFAESGGAIQFTVEENHVRFLINPEAGERAGLKFSSKLLALAKIVHEAPPGRRN
jgi:hypothetical protein